MKKINNLIRIIFAFIIILTLSSCISHNAKIALETKDYSVGLIAIEKVTDQDELTKISLEAEEPAVRSAAVRKLTDQSKLQKIAVEDKNKEVRLSAIGMLTDQSSLAKIAIEDEDENNRQFAVEKLTDQSQLENIANKLDGRASYDAISKLTNQFLLVKFALGDEYYSQAAVVKLTDPVILEKIANEKNDISVKFVYKLIKEFEAVPIKHRNRLMIDIFPNLGVLTDPKIAKEIGEVESIRVNWSPTSRTYGNESPKEMPGEIFKCSIKFKNLKTPLSNSWGTNFPVMADNFNFLPATVTSLDLFKPVLDLLSKSMLLKVSKHSHDSEVSACAQKRLDSFRRIK